MIKKTTTKEIRINHELIKKIPKNIEDNIIEDENTLVNSNYTKVEIKSLQYKSRLRKKILGNYVIDDIEFSKISLPCPAPGCKCIIFSQIFDKFEDEIKLELSNNSENNNIQNHKVSWKWDDWNLLKEKKRLSKKLLGYTLLNVFI